MHQNSNQCSSAMINVCIAYQKYLRPHQKLVPFYDKRNALSNVYHNIYQFKASNHWDCQSQTDIWDFFSQLELQSIHYAYTAITFIPSDLHWYNELKIWTSKLSFREKHWRQTIWLNEPSVIARNSACNGNKCNNNKMQKLKY